MKSTEREKNCDKEPNENFQLFNWKINFISFIIILSATSGRKQVFWGNLVAFFYIISTSNELIKCVNVFKVCAVKSK